MKLDEIKELFEKIELITTLDSIGILLPYIDDSSIDTVFNIVYRKKYEQCIEEFEGINEYDYICKILNFDLSELKRNIKLFSQKELLFIQYIIKSALTDIERNELTNKIIPILNEYKQIGTEQFLKEINEKKLEDFFNKYNVNELYTLDIILNYNNQCVKEYKQILNNILKEKEREYIADKCQNKSLYNILDKSDELTDEELNFLYQLVEYASSYLSSIQDYSYAYEQEIEDFNIDEYPIITIYKLEEMLLQKIESRKVNNKFLSL